MQDHVGFWLECHNRNCGFPIRVPYSPPVAKAHGRSPASAAILFACPVCLQVSAYGEKDFRKVKFRTPDPYKAGKLVLYSTRFGCAHRGCKNEVVVFTVAAVSISTAALLRLWGKWKMSLRCNQKHRFHKPDARTWWIQEEATLAGQGLRVSDLSNI